MNKQLQAVIEQMTNLAESGDLRQLVNADKTGNLREVLPALIKADTTGRLRAAMSFYPELRDGTGENRNCAIAKALDNDPNTRMLPSERAVVTKALVDELRPVRRLSYFEREQARALGKSLDAHGNINLAENANGASGQPTNRNFRAASKSVEQTFGVNKAAATETSSLGHQVKAGSVAKCKRYCYVPGRSCPNCLGQGFDWAQKQEKARMRKALSQQAQ